MNEKILTQGRFIRDAFLANRRRTSPDSLKSASDHDRSVELVALDTSHPSGNIYDEIVTDSDKGRQHIRLVKTTKPYNPDFIISAQTLSFFLPDTDYSKRIVTPKDGDRSSWQRFMAINQICADVITNYYRERQLGEFSILIGGSFNPYTDSDILRTQSVKSAHVHALLVSEAYLQETVSFDSPNDFRKFLSQGIRTPSELRMDHRRFFPNAITDAFNLFVSRKLDRIIKKKKYKSFTRASLEDSNTRFPVSGIKFVAKGLDFLSSDDFVDLLGTVSKEMEDIYKNDLMPLFAKNYKEAINSPSPESVQLKYNDIKTALYFFDKKIQELRKLGLTLKEIKNMRKIVTRIVTRSSSEKALRLNLGPAYAFSVLYEPVKDTSEIIISFNPFGGGTFDAIGLHKVWFPNEGSGHTEQRFNTQDSLIIEEELYKKIQEALSQST